LPGRIPRPPAPEGQAGPPDPSTTGLLLALPCPPLAPRFSVQRLRHKHRYVGAKGLGLRYRSLMHRPWYRMRHSESGSTLPTLTVHRPWHRTSIRNPDSRHPYTGRATGACHNGGPFVARCSRPEIIRGRQSTIGCAGWRGVVWKNGRGWYHPGNVVAAKDYDTRQLTTDHEERLCRWQVSRSGRQSRWPGGRTIGPPSCSLLGT
jgi:hypothetical protein